MADDAAWAFDADAWGASPNWEPGTGRTLYEDDLGDEEPVPRARSLVPVEPESDRFAGPS